MIILKNNDSIFHVWSGQLLYPSEQITIDESFRERLIDNSIFLQDLADGKAVINDTTQDLDSEIGLLWLKKQIKTAYIPMDYIGIVGEHAPALTLLNGAVFGYKLEIGDKLYIQKQLDSFIAPHVIFQLHLVIDNTESNKWIKFRLFILTTTGLQDKALNAQDIILDMDSKEIPTTPLLVFDMKTTLPVSLFQQEENNIFIGVERIELESGKDSPENNPIIVRGNIIFNQRLDI